MAASETSRYTLDKNSKTTLSVVVGAVLAVVAAYVWLDDRFDGLAASMDAIGHRVEQLEGREDRAWTQSQMSLWAVKLSKENPALTIPDPVTR